MTKDIFRHLQFNECKAKPPDDFSCKGWPLRRSARSATARALMQPFFALRDCDSQDPMPMTKASPTNTAPPVKDSACTWPIFFMACWVYEPPWRRHGGVDPSDRKLVFRVQPMFQKIPLQPQCNAIEGSHCEFYGDRRATVNAPTRSAVTGKRHQTA